ncbi:phage antirepressor Ant [Lactobacillus helveticus]|uniref:phage antirepressor KilAC domain-containing protein n=1 Tax=Lactobacillus helveticus TaxID=1587 RepID=UPI000D7BEB24|nr:phage antirepressor KilAC domain-containing protein [Lactobacillus helveticus]PXZ17804.1 phage antirepressor Ant [Lactobacillus helveticus]
MDSNLQLFSFEGQNLSIKEIDGQVYFDAEQTAIGLGLTKISKGKEYVRWERVNEYLGLSKSGQQVKRGDYITEPQFYKLAIKANNPVAEKFQDWVTSEVLPAIRKHGAYMTDQKAFDVVHNKNGLADLLQQAADQLKQKDIQIKEMKPKAMLADAITASETSILVGEMAKILKKNGINTGQNRFFKWLRTNGYLIKRKGTDYNMPTQKSMNLKLFEIKERTIVDGNSTRIVKTPKITGIGQQYFTNLFLS